MKKNLVITVLSVAAFAVGCKPSEEKSMVEMSAQSAADKVDMKARGAGQAAKELTQAKKEYAYAQKSEFVTEKQTQLAEINRDIDALSARVEASSDASKAEAKPKLQALRDQVARLNKNSMKPKAPPSPPGTM